MKFVKYYEAVIATIEKSCGNETVGDMWVETRIFPKETQVLEVIAWAEERDCNGKLIITIAEEV